VLSLIRKRVFGIAIAAVLVIVLMGAVGAFVSPSPHEIHTPGAQTLKTQLVGSDSAEYFSQAVQPSQSLNDVRCAIWRAGKSQSSVCPEAATLASMYFPNLTQSPGILYIAWLGCAYDFRADGFNVEYQSSRRAVVIHCYVARPWVWREFQTEGAVPRPLWTLLLVPTLSIQAGPVSVIEDYRVEHFFRDQSTESQMGTATIS
jgi:hypothetical protein